MLNSFLCGGFSFLSSFFDTRFACIQSLLGRILNRRWRRWHIIQLQNHCTCEWLSPDQEIRLVQLLQPRLFFQRNSINLRSTSDRSCGPRLWARRSRFLTSLGRSHRLCLFLVESLFEQNKILLGCHISLVFNLNRLGSILVRFGCGSRLASRLCSSFSRRGLRSSLNICHNRSSCRFLGLQKISLALFFFLCN